MDIEINATRYNLQYRCLLTDKDGNELTTKIVHILKPVVEVFEIVDEPEDFTGEIGEYANFTVNATAVASYQWQYSSNGTKWYSASGTGNKSASMDIEINATRYNLQYRCLLTDKDGNELTTKTVNIINPNVLKIRIQPTDTEGSIGEQVTFSLDATGVETYQWQYTSNGIKWYSATGTGNKTNSMTIEVNATRYNLVFRCLLTGKNGKELASDEVRIFNPDVVKIIEQPEDFHAEVGEYATFNVNAHGVASYQWQYTSNGTKWYSASGEGNKTATMTIQATAARYNLSFRCLMLSNDGTEYVTNSVKIVSDKIIINNVTYEAITETTCAVVAYTGTASSLTIPETVEGMTVVEIGVEAFMDNKSLVSIDLPDTITVIRARAFKGCTSLSDMH